MVLHIAVFKVVLGYKRRGEREARGAVYSFASIVSLKIGFEVETSRANAYVRATMVA